MKHPIVPVSGLVAIVLMLAPVTGWAAEKSTPPPAMSDVNARDESGNTPLHLAALRSDAAAVEALLEHKADAGAINKAGATPLHYGTASERIVSALLAKGAPADVASKFGITPLLTAVARPGSLGVARRLIAAGANVNQLGNGPRAFSDSVLVTAILDGDRDLVELLLQHGAEVNRATGMLPLSAALSAGDLETTQLLLDRGADVNHRIAPSPTPLVAAARSSNFDGARLLIERGLTLDPATLRRSTRMPLMVWSGYSDTGDPALAQLLVANGADVNVTNENGETALDYALKRGSATPVVKFLREAGGRSASAPQRGKIVPTRDVPTEPAARSIAVRAGVQRAIDVLQRGSTAFLENSFVRKSQCTSCHQQALPAVAFGLAAERGFRLDEPALGQQLHAMVEELVPQVEAARQMTDPVPNARVTLGYNLDALYAHRFPSDATTDAMSLHLLGRQHGDGSWKAFVRRPPIEDGPLVGTAWSIRALQLYPPSTHIREVEIAFGRARDWLARQEPRTPNERVFQLLGLAWANASVERMRPFAERLIKNQASDGAWVQLPGLPGDAWATGSALVALQKAGIPTTHAAYQRGVEFLLRTQFDDGSWWVRSRSQPIQPHFDGRFPHGKDQWISAAGTAWASIALLFTLEPHARPGRPPDAKTLIARFVSTAADSNPRANRAAPSVSAETAPISFVRDIKPLFQRSCADCHTGERVKGGFSVASRESMLKGGQSGDPAIIPGRSQESHLLRFVSDQVEDLEMPPLRRREDYPALNRNEITLVRTWIDGGAKWGDAP